MKYYEKYQDMKVKMVRCIFSNTSNVRINHLYPVLDTDYFYGYLILTDDNAKQWYSNHWFEKTSIEEIL